MIPQPVDEMRPRPRHLPSFPTSRYPLVFVVEIEWKYEGLNGSVGAPQKEVNDGCTDEV